MLIWEACSAALNFNEVAYSLIIINSKLYPTKDGRYLHTIIRLLITEAATVNHGNQLQKFFILNTRLSVKLTKVYNIHNMHDNHSVIVSVLVLVSSIGIAIAASLSIESSLLSEVKSVANNGTRNGNTEEQCQCVVFHLCDQNNVINVTAADNQYVLINVRV